MELNSGDLFELKVKHDGGYGLYMGGSKNGEYFYPFTVADWRYRIPEIRLLTVSDYLNRLGIDKFSYVERWEKDPTYRIFKCVHDFPDNKGPMYVAGPGTFFSNIKKIKIPDFFSSDLFTLE